MSGPGWGKPGRSSGGGSSNGVGARTTSGSVTGIGWFGCGIVGMDARSIFLNHAERNLSVMR